MQEINGRSTRRRRRGGRAGRRAGVVVTLAVLVVVAVLWALAGGGGDEDAWAPAAPDTASTPTSEAPATTAERPAPLPAPASGTTVGESPAPAAATRRSGETSGGTEPPVLADGRHPVYFNSFDLAGSTVDFDLVQYLTGGDAQAYADEHVDEYGEEFRLDQYVINENPRLRTLPVARDVEVTVLRTAESYTSPHPITFGELPGYVGTNRGPGGSDFISNVFWLTARDGTVVAIDEQFSP